MNQHASALANVENEAALLSTLMMRPGAIDEVCDAVTAEDFAEPAHAVIYEAILNESAQGRAVNPIALGPLVGGHPSLRPLDGQAYLATLTGTVHHFLKADEAAGIVASLAARRRLISVLADVSTAANDVSISLPELVDRSDAALVGALDKRHVMHQATLEDSIGEAIARIEAIQANDGKVGATTDIDELDELLGGFEPGQLIVVAGRPGMGKTAVACSAALGLARSGSGVLFASLEMKSAELGMRMVSDLCCQAPHDRIPFDRIVNATVSSQQIGQLRQAQRDIKAWPLRIIDHGSLSLARLILGVRRTKRRMAAKGQTLKVLVVDYLQLLMPDGKGLSAYESVSQISRGLKALAKDLDITVIALAQLSRAVEQREDKRPMLSDLRDSGQIEQDADAVLFLYRAEYYLDREKPKKGQEEDHAAALERSRGLLSLICAKRRNGRTGERSCRYLTPYQAIRPIRWSWA